MQHHPRQTFIVNGNYGWHKDGARARLSRRHPMTPSDGSLIFG
jgi:hypothetical protein